MILILQRLKILFFLLTLTFIVKLNAQECDQIGIVSNGILLGKFNCELLIISFDGLEVFQPTSSSEDLIPGNLIRFSYETFDSAGCAEDVPLINITCLEPVLLTEECFAEFFSFPNDILFSREYVFEPLIFDSTKIYQWDFGDGEQSDLAQTNHLFANSGEFIVCLTVTDGDSCTNTVCDTLLVGSPILNTCNFSIESILISDSTGSESYQLEVFNQIDFGPYRPQTVKWYEYETGKVIGIEPLIVYEPAPTSPPIINICIDISVVFPDSSECETTICHPIILENNLPMPEICQSLFGYLPNNPILADGKIDFFNFSFGDFTEALWDFGDGQTTSSLSDALSHTYESLGLYQVCLTLKDSLNSCESTLCLPVFTVGGTEICTYNDCVFPGDANKDGSVNIFDLLNLGVGYNATGEIRPNAVNDPILQAAFDWGFNTIVDLNFKHIDCDGNGVINESDYTAIDQNYQKVSGNLSINQDVNLPEVSLQFAADTIVVNPNQEKISIPASIIVGATGVPIENFYGIALSFDYEGEVIQSIETVYDSSSFIGNSNDVFERQKNLKEDNQLGLAISRKNQIGIDGGGKIAEVGFIVVGDLIEGRSAVIGLDLNDLVVIGPNGEEIPVTVPTEEAVVTIIFDENFTVNTEDQLSSQQFAIYPNPAKEALVISLGKELNLFEGRIEIFNTIGQKVIQQSLHNYQMILDISVLETGVYWVKIHTQEGVGIKEIVVD